MGKITAHSNTVKVAVQVENTILVWVEIPGHMVPGVTKTMTDFLTGLAGERPEGITQ